MNITQATVADIDAITELIRQAVRIMQKNGIDQWNDNYPNKNLVTDDVAMGSLFKITVDGNIAGIVTLNELQFPDYSKIHWKDSTGRPLVVHRLCIDPRYQGKSLAKRLMFFAEEYAKKNGYSSIRLDTYSKNYIALKLYKSLKYEQGGDVSLREGKVFHCFEKAIKPKS